MSKAVLYFHQDAYDTTGARLMGRHAAGESFLRGYLRHGTAETLHLWNVADGRVEAADALVRRIEPITRPITWHRSRLRLRDVGVLSMPVPGLPGEAWARRPIGDQAYAISGVTHTTATAVVMQTVAELLLAPLYDYDALICTSSAVRTSIETQLSDVRRYLAEEFGPRRRPEPTRVTIPLGVNTADFRTSPENRKAWRERLNIPEDAIVALYVGRFSPNGKMNPALMAQALEQAAKRTSKRLYWVNSGWAGAESAEAYHHDNTRALCPSVEYRHVDGRGADVRFSIWSVADFFISFSDNIQETFGLTPIEAMAAGLPCVVTDWDGYRDTVRDGEDGFRIATYAPPPGAGGDFAYAFADNRLDYSHYIGGVSQFTAMDLGAAAQAIVDLAENADLRARMGAQAQARAASVFDWSVVIPQYEALWAEQDARRRVSTVVATWPGNPFRPDPFALFAGYPTRHLRPTWRVSTPPGLSWEAARTMLTSPLATHSPFGRPQLGEMEQVFEWLAANGPATVSEVIAVVPQARGPFVERGLLWMARFGSLLLTPDET